MIALQKNEEEHTFQDQFHTKLIIGHNCCVELKEPFAPEPYQNDHRYYDNYKPYSGMSLSWRLS